MAAERHCILDSTLSDVQAVETQLSRFLKAEEMRRPEFRAQIGEIQQGLRQSRRQYVGLVIQGEKQILVNAFPKDQTLPWKRQFIEVSDGARDIGVFATTEASHISESLIQRSGIMRYPSNHTVERTATRRAFKFRLAWAPSLRSAHGPGGRRSLFSR